MTHPPTPAPDQNDAITPRLGSWDAVSIIIGIVVGTAIYKVPQMIFGNVAGPWQGMGAWLLGGVLALIGALCYAELATTYPRSGGDYVYLTRAYGPWVGFLFGWAQLAVILTGSIGVMAFAFADYSIAFWAGENGGDRTADLTARWSVWLAAVAVVALSAMNLLGVALGKMTQNVLTVLKVVGLGGVVVAGFLWGGPDAGAAASGGAADAEKTGSLAAFGLAMVFVLYAYGGWNDAAFVAAEVRDRRRNIPRALILGTTGITLVYLLVNAAYLYGLGFEGVRKSPAPAADVLGLALGDTGKRAMSLLVMISALGAVNGLIFTGARVYSSMGKDHSVFALLGRWSPRFGVPVWSLLAQAVIALLLIVAVGTAAGRGVIDGALRLVRLKALPWEEYFGGFDTLVAGTAPVFWTFFLLTGISLFVLRMKDRGIERPFSAPLFPLTPIVFCLMCVYMLYSSIAYAKWLTLLGVVPLAVGLPLYFISRRTAVAEPTIPTYDAGERPA